MSVKIEIEDGPQDALSASPAIVPGRMITNPVTQVTSFQAAMPLQLPQGSDYAFEIKVRNTGTEDASSRVLGTFENIVAPVLDRSPDGKFFARVHTISGITRIGIFLQSNSSLFANFETIDGNDIGFESTARTRVLFSSDSTLCVLLRILKANDKLIVKAVNLVDLSTSGSAIRAGSIFANSESRNSLKSRFNGPDSVAFGFVPSQKDLLFLSWSENAGGVRVGFLSLEFNTRKFVESPQAGTPAFATSSATTFLFSPSGDLLVVFGNVGSPFVLLKMSSTGTLVQSVTWVQRGMIPSPPPPSAGPPGTNIFKQTKGGGFEAIQASIDGRMFLLDSPTPALPAVVVNVFVGQSTTVLNTGPGTALVPVGTSPGNPSAFIDSIPHDPADNERTALVIANWIPQAAGHYCIVAEAHSNRGVVPSDPQRRSSTILDPANPQIAQRNVQVV